jgi:hypothetical protein
MAIIRKFPRKNDRLIRDYFRAHLTETEKEKQVQRAADRAANPEKYLARELRRAGVSLATYKRMLERQGGRCAICGKKSPDKGHARFSVDHDHRTGKIRGLLCRNCNAGIRFLKDNPRLVLKVFSYLCKT